MTRASTEMEKIPQIAPVIHPRIDFNSVPARNQQGDVAERCARPDAERAIRDGAVVLTLTWTVIDRYSCVA